MALSDTTTSGTPPPELINAAHRVDFTLRATAESVADARHRIRRVLGVWNIADDIRDMAALVMSELVTNAIVHTDTRTVTCVLTTSSNLLLIQVEDHGTEPSVSILPVAAAQEERGRGLLLVEVVSQSWGATSPDSGTDGRRVWATLNTAGE